MEPNLTEPANSQRSDDELVELAQSGDIESAKVLFMRCYPMLTAYAGTVCGDESLAKDAVQEAYLRFFVSFNRFTPTHKFKPWVKGIIKNIIREEWRFRGKIKDFGTKEVPKDIENIEDRKSETIGDKLDRKDFEELLAGFPEQLADLDQGYQQVGGAMLERLRKGEEPLSSDEIAQKTGISRRSVYRYRDTFEKRWKRQCEKRGFDPCLVEKILGKKKNEPV
jgi:RNA polymerase sigma factor (sigma-70 family)